MKKTFISLIIILLAFDANSQSSYILPSAVVLPKFTTNPVCTVNEKGRLIFNTTINKCYYCDGSTWINMAASGLVLPDSLRINIPSTALVVENYSTGDAIRGKSDNGMGVFGRSNYSIGVQGYSISNYGVYGGSNSENSVGVYGGSAFGYGIRGNSVTNYSGYFDGKVKIGDRLAIGGNTLDNDVIGNLHIKGMNDGTWDQGIHLESPTSSNYGGILYDNDGMKFRNFQSDDEYIFRDYNNNTTVRISPIGNIYLDGTVFPNSDIRLKRNIQPISFSLKNLQKLKGYNYYWKEAKTDDDLQTGLIAQEVQAIFPELVATDEDGMLSVNYMGLIPHLVEAVKELNEKNKKIEDLEARISKIEKLLK